MRLRPNGDRVLVRRHKAETTTPGGLLLPQSHTEAPWSGDVLEIGPDARQKPGDKIMFSRYAGTMVEVNKEVLYLLHDKEIFGTLEEG